MAGFTLVQVIQTSFEVLVRTRFLLIFAFSVGCAAPLVLAQAAPATAPVDTQPPATQGQEGSLPAYPAYDQMQPKAPAPAVAVPPPAPSAAPQEVAPAGVPQDTKVPNQAYAQYGPGDSLEAGKADWLGSAYIPLDSWVYPAMTRLYSLGYVDTMFLGMRPWTRRSTLHMLQKSQDSIVNGNSEQAQEILASMLTELQTEIPQWNRSRGPVYGLESAYTRMMVIGGPTLRDSYHLGQTINNDYGRPYQSGFNNSTGVSAVGEVGPFSIYVRGEYQHAPSGDGYSQSLSSELSLKDILVYSPPNAPQATIPTGPIAAQNPFRLIEAAVSTHLLGHEISLGKTDAWLGPGMGGAMAWSNNAENIYSFRVNRIEPLYIPLVSRISGPMRYDFFIGSLKGHTAPNHPWIHAEMFSFRPTRNFEFGFERTIIFGGAGHQPVTLHTFLKGFFSTRDTTVEEKFSRDDPGARFSIFNFSWRLPFVRDYATLYLDSMAHDDVTPISAPRRAAYRTGLYLSHIPRLSRLDLRLEGVTTDPGVRRSNGGTFNYFEVVQLQGYTNKGFILGDWIGREAKGGQAWLTYHLSGNEWVQLEYLNKKTPKDFIAGGTTQNQFKVDVVKRLSHDVELNAWVQYERWKAPIYKAGQQSNTVAAFQVTWYPKLHSGSAQ